MVEEEEEDDKGVFGEEACCSLEEALGISIENEGSWFC